MARKGQAKRSDDDNQPDLFGVEAAPVYRPDPDKVRSRLHRILGQARAAETMPWEPTTLSLYRVIFPRMANYLPEDEAARFCASFDEELKRFEAA